MLFFKFQFLTYVAGNRIDSCILWPCYTHLLVLISFLKIILAFSTSFHLQIKTSFFISLQCARLLFLFLLTRLGRAPSAISYRNGERSHLDLRHKASFFTIKYDGSCRLFIEAFFKVKLLFISLSFKIFIILYVEFCHFFLHLLW